MSRDPHPNALLVLLQTLGDGLHPVSLSALGAALRLGRQGQKPVLGLVLAGCLPFGAQKQLEESGLDAAYACLGESLEGFLAEAHCEALVACVKKLHPDVLLAGATPEGRVLAAMAAAALGTGVTADCTALSFRADGLLLQTRPAFGGQMMADIITPQARPQMATLRYGAPHAPARQIETPVIQWALQAGGGPAADSRVEWVDRVTQGAAKDAERILVLGGGLAAKEDVPKFEKLAEQLDADLMCTRALVERGWLPRQRQIGLSGRSVAPKLLLCLGVSGSVQFQAGAQQAKTICAVNRDENAPIMKWADLPVVGDLYEITQQLAKAVEATKR